MFIKQLFVVEMGICKMLFPYFSNFVVVVDRGGLFSVLDTLRYFKCKYENLPGLTEISSDYTFLLIMF